MENFSFNPDFLYGTTAVVAPSLGFLTIDKRGITLSHEIQPTFADNPKSLRLPNKLCETPSQTLSQLIETPVILVSPLSSPQIVLHSVLHFEISISPSANEINVAFPPNGLRGGGDSFVALANRRKPSLIAKTLLLCQHDSHKY